jgi:hypothetical protein
MAKFMIAKPDGSVKYVKKIDKTNQTIEFTTDEDEAYVREGWFYPEAELKFIKHYFMEEYPELEYCTLLDLD